MVDPVERQGAAPPAGGGTGARDAAAGQPGEHQAGPAATMSIGEVLAVLKPEFPDITVSKIRFLEGAGLIRPDRSASGYRKFSEDDVARLRFVLRAQRDQYLPLRVIRQRLADLEAGGELRFGAGPAGAPAPLPPAGRPPAGAQAGRPATAPRHVPAPERGGPPEAQPARAGLLSSAPPSDAQFSRDELCRAAGTSADRLAELEDFGLIAARGSTERGSWYGGDDLVVLRLARDPEARTRAREMLEALAELGSRMRDVALRSAVSGFTEATEARRR